MRADFDTRFGTAAARTGVGNYPLADEIILLWRNLAWVRDWSALERAHYDSEQNQLIQIRIQVAMERNYDLEEIAYALDGVRVECEKGLDLASPKGHEAAVACLELLERLEGRGR